MFHSCMNASDFRRSPLKIIGGCLANLSGGCPRCPPPPPAGFPPGLPPPPPPPGFPPPPPGFPLPGGPKGVFSGLDIPCPPPPLGGPVPPVVVFLAEELEGWAMVDICVVVCVVVAMKILEKMFPGWRFVGVGMASAIFCSSISLSVVP